MYIDQFKISHDQTKETYYYELANKVWAKI